MNDKLKTELDVISNIHQEIVKSTFIKERLEQTKNAYKREYDALVKDLIKKSDEYNLVKNKDVEDYIKSLSEKSSLTFKNLLDS
jgi:chemotaxis regulatin CheY-phosphate phosphatase CheZ